ncbi:hypothetical protein PsYK624_166340 [Phanerochaete sordida]|uniref:Uncharacterized protein n=1 Tax=Phanerochaete sordida TaxID=48140 RepID=A0A9P3LM19_9APHY|nr:hypothetical protein PsYK624_166340 [Phanerochaete sordida]
MICRWGHTQTVRPIAGPACKSTATATSSTSQRASTSPNTLQSPVATLAWTSRSSSVSAPIWSPPHSPRPRAGFGRQTLRYHSLQSA